MILKFQEGGAMPMEQAPQEGGNEQMAQLEQMAGAIVQELGPEGAMALAEMIAQMIQGGAEEQVAYNKNGKKVMKRKKCATGAKMKKCAEGNKMRKC